MRCSFEAGCRIQPLQDWLAGNARTLDAGEFASSMVHPFSEFNFAITAADPAA